MTRRNFLPEQYRRSDALPINHNYLREQFADPSPILAEIEALVKRGDYTLGEAVDRFEAQIAELTGSRHVVAVGSGTDAIRLSLLAAGVGPGDEVITPAFTFFATVGAVATTGARPVFADSGWDCNLDPERVAAAITPRTKAIVPVHWSGRPCDMDRLLSLSDRHGVALVEDACHGIRAEYRGRALGTFGIAGCFSLHPLKNLNVWGDGGYVVTDSDEVADRLRLLRNHGLVNREETALWGFNSRLDSLQAIVATHMLARIDDITEARIANAARYDGLLGDVPGVTLPARHSFLKEVYHLYVIRSDRRDALQRHLIERGIDAKVHYPVPMHLQPAAADLGYRRGDLPVAESLCQQVLSLPVHEYITSSQIDFVVEQVRAFHRAG